MKYTEGEMNLIDEMYTGNGMKVECTYRDIISECNRIFHNNKAIRTIGSISYALIKLYKFQKK